MQRLVNGNFFISINTIRTAFEKFDPLYFHSQAYDNFLYYRKIIADRLADRRRALDPNYTAQPVLDTATGEYFPQGYGPTSQDVLIPALLAAYSGFDPTKIDLSSFPAIPLPDWRVSFDGLKNLPLINKVATKITLTHSYASTFTINNFQSNPNFDFDSYEQLGYSTVIYESTGDFVPVYEMGAVSISERFVPFVGLDMQFKNKMSIRLDYKKTRDIFLSFSNNQIRERHSDAITFGAGYIIPDVKVLINTGAGPQTIKSDLNIRVDLTYEHTYEIYRRILENINQLNIERRNFVLSITGDYSINDKVSVQFYYNHNIICIHTTVNICSLKVS
jgi:cell surface protein SprA